MHLLGLYTSHDDTQNPKYQSQNDIDFASLLKGATAAESWHPHPGNLILPSQNLKAEKTCDLEWE